MKKTALLLAALLLFLTFPGRAGADYDPEVDYLSIMVRAAACGDIEAGRAAEICRNEKIDKTGSDEVKIAFEDLFLLAKIITSEAGSERLSDEWRMCVGEVVLNRVASPEFPDTVEEVILQEGQYAGADTEEFTYYLNPTEDSVNAALRLLQGERLMDPWVVFQANFPQGGGVYAKYYDSLYGYTYFCSSSHPELYW